MSASVVFGKKQLAVHFELLKKDNTYIIQPKSNNRDMMVCEFLPLLRNKAFSQKLSDILLSIPYKAITFETTLIKEDHVEEPITIKVKEDTLKKGLWPNYSSFSKLMNNWGYAHHYLIPPTNTAIVFPHATDRDFSHLMTFLKNSDEDERSALWDKIATLSKPTSKGIRIHTSMDSIPWLNIHIS